MCQQQPRLNPHRVPGARGSHHVHPNEEAFLADSALAKPGRWGEAFVPVLIPQLLFVITTVLNKHLSLLGHEGPSGGTKGA